MQLLKDLMSRDVKVVSPDMTIEEAARKMRDGDFGMMPAGEGDRMIGTISDRDRRLVGIVALGVLQSKARKSSRLPRRFRKISKPSKPLRYHLRPS